MTEDNNEPKKRRGRPTTELTRWTVERACRELPINPRTMVSRLAAQSIEPDAEGFYTLIQIVRAFSGGDLEQERIREVRSKADLNEQELRTKQGLLVDKDELVRQWQARFVSMVRIVKSSKLTEDEQIEMLKELEAVLK